jgi:bifunctional N-acetylglucosamine-1-phosphate-uridyltransferase/glucosamine-1-phosphate-acetyltransferase GlmU-like protein
MVKSVKPLWYSPDNFFDLRKLQSTPAQPLFEGLTRVWEILDRLEPFITTTVQGNVAKLRRKGDFQTEAVGLWQGRVFWGVTYKLGDPTRSDLKVSHKGRPLPGAALILPGVTLIGDDIEIGEGALVESGALIKGPVIIGPYSEVRQGAYIRGAVMLSPGSVIGHATEAKNALLLAGAKAGHFAYIGDSVLGVNVNLGAGVKLANLKMKESPYLFQVGEEKFELHRRKFGAIIGDDVKIGCNTVTNPGTLIGPGLIVLPNTSVPPGYHRNRATIDR